MCLIMTKSDSKSAVIEAAFEVFSRDPSASLSVVAARAGVGRATLHRHFPGRAALLSEMTTIAIAELDAAVDQAVATAETHTEGLRLALRAMVPLGPRQWFLNTDAGVGDGEVQASIAEGRAELIAAIDAAKSEGCFDPQTPSAWIAEAFDALLYMAWTMVRSELATTDQAADFAWKMLIQDRKGGPA